MKPNPLMNSGLVKEIKDAPAMQAFLGLLWAGFGQFHMNKARDLMEDSSFRSHVDFFRGWRGLERIQHMLVMLLMASPDIIMSQTPGWFSLPVSRANKLYFQVNPAVMNGWWKLDVQIVKLIHGEGSTIIDPVLRWVLPYYDSNGNVEKVGEIWIEGYPILNSFHDRHRGQHIEAERMTAFFLKDEEAAFLSHPRDVVGLLNAGKDERLLRQLQKQAQSNQVKKGKK